MKKFAVGYINFFDNELKINIVEAENWKDALCKGSPMGPDWIESDTMAEAKEKAFDMDSMFDVVEIK